MKRIMLLSILVLVLSHCSPQQHSINLTSVTNLQVIGLPFELSTRAAIETEERFDQSHNDLKSTFVLGTNGLNLKLGQRLKQPRVFSIRAKVLFKINDGKSEKIFIQGTGAVMYNGDIYNGSEQIDILMARIDSARIANGAPN